MVQIKTGVRFAFFVPFFILRKEKIKKCLKQIVNAQDVEEFFIHRQSINNPPLIEVGAC